MPTPFPSRPASPSSWPTGAKPKPTTLNPVHHLICATQPFLSIIQPHHFACSLIARTVHPGTAHRTARADADRAGCWTRRPDTPAFSTHNGRLWRSWFGGFRCLS